MTDLDKKLQELASTDWKQFLQIIGKDSIVTAKARILRREGKSYQQISIKLELSTMQVRHACSKNTKLLKNNSLDATG